MRALQAGLVIGAVVVALSGCATPQPLATASGRPEVTICSGIDRKAVRDRLVERMVANGGRVQSVNDYSITISKPSDDFMTSLLYGSRFNATPDLRLTVTFVDTESGCQRLFATAAIVTNPGSGFENQMDATVGAGPTLLASLESFKGRIESEYPRAGGAPVSGAPPATRTASNFQPLMR